MAHRRALISEAPTPAIICMEIAVAVAAQPEAGQLSASKACVEIAHHCILGEREARRFSTLPIWEA